MLFAHPNLRGHACENIAKVFLHRFPKNIPACVRSFTR